MVHRHGRVRSLLPSGWRQPGRGCWQQRIAPPKTTTTVADRLVRADLPAGDCRELLGLLAALARLRLPRERLLERLGRDPMIREVLGDPSVAQGW